MDAPQPQASYPCGNFSDTYNQIYFMGFNVIIKNNVSIIHMNL